MPLNSIAYKQCLFFTFSYSFVYVLTTRNQIQKHNSYSLNMELSDFSPPPPPIV